MRRLGLFLSVLVFLHALLFAPLLVECVAADGRILIELIGVDPCHDSSAGIRFSIAQHSNSNRLVDASEPADPCEDLILDFLNCAQICSDSLVLVPQPADEMIQLNPSQPEAVLDSGITKVNRETPGWSGPDSHSSLTLRI